MTKLTQKNKKLSKSSIAVIVLAVLLVLSMVMGLTGAWFHDNVENADVPSAQFGFGKVDINGSGEASVTYTIAQGDVTKMVDGDKITVADTLAITNNSNVDILVVVDKSAAIAVTGNVTTQNIIDWFGLSASNQSAKLAVNAGDPISLTGSGAGVYELDSENAANGVTGTFQITITCKVYAVQKGNINTLEDLKGAFQAAGYAGYDALTLADFGLSA